MPFSLTGQVLGTANFNIPGATAPLTITNISPALTATAGAQQLTVTGTGFTTDPSVTYTYYVSPVPGITYTGPTRSSVQRELIDSNSMPGDLATAGYYQIAVLNAVASDCNPDAYLTFRGH